MLDIFYFCHAFGAVRSSLSFCIMLLCSIRLSNMVKPVCFSATDAKPPYLTFALLTTFTCPTPSTTTRSDFASLLRCRIISPSPLTSRSHLGWLYETSFAIPFSPPSHLSCFTNLCSWCSLAASAFVCLCSVWLLSFEEVSPFVRLGFIYRKAQHFSLFRPSLSPWVHFSWLWWLALCPEVEDGVSCLLSGLFSALFACWVVETMEEYFDTFGCLPLETLVG